MCDDAQTTVRKSTSDGELLTQQNTHYNSSTSIEMTLNPDQLPPSRLKRTFTLPRNPIRMSKRKPKVNREAVEKEVIDTPNNRRIFRTPSLRKIITKIAQHIGGVPENNRVPPVGLQTWPEGQTPGVTGLRNQGNTCFINAVLQCISNTDVLAEYFVLDRYKDDLMRRNKLNSKKYGTKGEVTEQLATVLKALWACQYNSELSTAFKQAVERHGAQYKGSQQHDALEFLQWLLDKVHEDLNMASKRKYKSIKTAGRPDEVIAAETLENYKRCNNSFIQSIFQAQYRSSLSCSRCLTQSNTFDPFQCISVQLPQLHRHSIYVTVLYTSQQPRQVKIGLSLPSGATVSELRDILESDTSIERSAMLITEIGSGGFLRTFTDAQAVTVITEIDPIYCIEVPQLKDVEEEDVTSPYVLLCWINVEVNGSGDGGGRFGSPYTMQVARDTSYVDLQKLVLKEMAPILHDDILTGSQEPGIFKMRISDPACDDNEPPCYLEPDLEHPLFMEAVDQALALCSEEGGPPHLKLVLEWSTQSKTSLIADDSDVVEEHSSVKQLRAQALQGGAPLTLEECLRHYTRAETLTMDDAWRCPHCQQYLPVVKTLDIWSLPDILIVHFKRFRQQTLRGRNSTKLTTMVDFPVYGFDMSPHLAGRHHTNNNSNMRSHDDPQNILGWSPWKRPRKQSSSGDNIYDLYAVCYHRGSDLETGHYTAACKNSYDNNWYLYDDAKVTNLSEKGGDIRDELVNNGAYILFYQRRSNGVNTASSSSSAASTSSVCSGGEHWVTRMSRFQLPKTMKKEEKRPNKEDEEETQQKPPTEETEEEKLEPKTNSDVVALRNSQNALYNSSSSLRKSQTTTEESEVPKRPMYRTSIYINSSGNVDITTTCEEKSPVTSGHRVNGLTEQEVSIKVEEAERVYKTTAAVHTCGEEEKKRTYYSDGVVRGGDERVCAPPAE